MISDVVQTLTWQMIGLLCWYGRVTWHQRLGLLTWYGHPKVEIFYFFIFEKR